MYRGWFENGPRTLAEQMKGLESMLAEAAGKTVLDLGCAEGLIAIEVANAGAARVDACDNNAVFVTAAMKNTFQEARGDVDVHWADLNAGMPAWTAGGYDIVLALAIIHKLNHPSEKLAAAAAIARDLLVIRLPVHAFRGEFSAKHRPDMKCNVHQVLPPLGFVLERDVPGPRRERVQYWRRTK